jgi:hypothetical protein
MIVMRPAVSPNPRPQQLGTLASESESKPHTTGGVRVSEPQINNKVLFSPEISNSEAIFYVYNAIPNFAHLEPRCTWAKISN